MSTQTYKFYMQEVTQTVGGYTKIGTEVDLEKDFKGLKYLKCEGLEDIGESRIYTETYADSDKTRVFIPTDLTNEPTAIKLTLIFIGENRRSLFNSFNEYIRKGFHAYWDTARNKEIIFYVKESIKPSDDIYKGSTPYIQCTYTLTNVYGKSTNVQ